MANWSKLQARECIQETCGEGWLPLVDEVFEKLPPNIAVTSAFQKWGALRFYCEPQDDEFEDYLELIAERSLKTCETCGEPGIEMIVDGWVVTRCDLHSIGCSWRSDGEC